MQGPFRLLGSEESAASQKVRSYLAYKRAECVWTPRTHERNEEFQRYARLPLLPILVGAGDEALQGSTAILDAIEREIDEPSILPDDPMLAFLSALLEDYADEWVSKIALYHRWTGAEDQAAAAQRLTHSMFGPAPEGRDIAALTEVVRQRMHARLRHVGATGENAVVLEQSLLRLAEHLEAHLASRRYLFGDRPSAADFALAAEVRQMLRDPTPGALLRERAPHVTAWAERCEAAGAEGPFEDWASLAATLLPLLRTDVTAVYLTWAAANAAAGDEPFVVDLLGHRFKQAPQRMAASALAALRRKRALVDGAELTGVLEAMGANALLAASDEDGEEGEEDGGEE